MGLFKMADASEKGFGKRCSSRRDCEMAGSACRRPSRACAVVCWRARSGRSECANRRVTWQVHIGTFRAPVAFGQFWSDGGRCGLVRDLLG